MAEFRRRRLTRGQKVVIAAALIPALAFPMWLFGGSYLRGRDAAISRAREATIEGPPCPSLTRAQFDARGLKAPKATLYEGVTFARRVGHMDCSILRYGGGGQYGCPHGVREGKGRAQGCHGIPADQPSA